VDVNWTGAICVSEIDGFLDHVARLSNVVEEIRALGGSSKHRSGVRRAAFPGRLVQRPETLPDDAGIAADRQHRIRIGHGDGEAGKQIEGAGAGGGKAHAQTVGIDGVAASHKRSSLLVAHDDRPDLAGVLERHH